MKSFKSLIWTATLDQCIVFVKTKCVRPAASLKSGQSNLKRNFSSTNVECQLTNVELRNSFYFIF